MTRGYRRTIQISGLVAITVGLLCSGLVIFDENGYVASMTFVIVFFLLVGASFVLLTGGLVGLAADDKRVAVFVIIISILTPTSFLTFCLIAKVLGIGTYREEPMIPLEVTWTRTCDKH